MKARTIGMCVILVGIFSACGQPPPPPEARPTHTPTPIPPDSIRWDKAKTYVGEFKIVCGPVVDTAYASGSTGKPTFLNLGRSYPDPERFTVVIWDGNRANFPAQPENYYLGKDICVDGLIELYKGGAQIEGTTQDQIDIQ